MTKTVQEIAQLLGGELKGDGSLTITGVASLESAGPGDITFAVDQYVEAAHGTKASAIVLGKGSGDFEQAAIYVDDAKAAFAKLLSLYAPPVVHETGVSDRAYIGKNVKLGKDVTILAFAYVDDYAEIGDNVTLYPGVFIGQHAVIGEGSTIYPNATVREGCVVGKRNIIHASAVIGSDGFGFTPKDGVHVKMQQIGNVVLGDDVEIGSHVGVDRAAMGSTTVGDDTKIDNLVHIGHNDHIGKHNLIVAQTGISGSVTTGDNCTFGGQVGTVGHITIGGNSIYAARSGITNNMPENYFGAGFPVQPHQEWLRMEATLKRLPAMLKKFKELEKKIAKYESMFGFGNK